MDSLAPRPSNSAVLRTQKRIVAACDPVLSPYLQKQNDREADRCLDSLHAEFISPVVRRELAGELRRSHALNEAQLHQEAEAFRELDVLVAGRVVERLIRLRASVHSTSDTANAPIRYFNAYIQTAVQNAVTDYLRKKRPGRRSLDLSLQAALKASSDLAVWQISRSADFTEWRCGRHEWRDAFRSPVLLRNELSLQKKLLQGIVYVSRRESLATIFHIVSAPLLYDDLLNFLASVWDVEAPFRASMTEASQLRAPTLTGKVSDLPERIATRIGTLQEIWEAVTKLSTAQAATLLLRLPPSDRVGFLEEFIRLGITNESDIAKAVGLPEAILSDLLPELPLDDRAIADRIGVDFDDVRRIRQDAQRRLERMRVNVEGRKKQKNSV
jgi:hypothetical protein